MWTPPINEGAELSLVNSLLWDPHSARFHPHLARSHPRSVRSTSQRSLCGVHSIMVEKLAQACECGGGGARLPPFTISTITYKVVVYRTLQLIEQTHSTLFLLYPFVYFVVQTVRAGPEQGVGHHLPHQGHTRPAGHRDWSFWKPPGNYGPICSEKKALKSMLRNRDILVRKRIRGGPWLWLLDPDPDPAVFVIDLQDASKKLIFLQIFSAY